MRSHQDRRLLLPTNESRQPHRRRAATEDTSPRPAQRPPTTPPPADRAPIPNCPPGFANDSEHEFARILDFYQITWQYEPHSFPVTWDDQGQPTSYFSPDFYLPELDTYIELTTLRQRLVTKKNRKLRLLRQLYPDINIKLLYARDFHSLMRKYGLGGPPATSPTAEPATQSGASTDEQHFPGEPAPASP